MRMPGAASWRQEKEISLEALSKQACPALPGFQTMLMKWSEREQERELEAFL